MLVGALEDLGWDVVESAKARVCDLVVLVDGEAEIGELDLVVVAQQDVLGLQIAMDEAADVNEGERREQRPEDLQRRFGMTKE